MPMPTGKGPNFTDSERFETPKMDCAIKFKTKNSISSDSRFVDLKSTGERATLTRGKV